MADGLPAIRGVESSSVSAVGYDPMTRRLYLRFVGSGNAYLYHDVPPAVFDDLMRAESKGGFVNAMIKGSYDFRRL
ncbi:MAG: KTSC domain-containing protein [Gammaproteobacteria bacterium]|nr:KTSC domain-containing protein [Gammaproteobacteria bacterium]